MLTSLIQFNRFVRIFVISLSTCISVQGVCEEINRQAIPIGMFNVYSREEDNLGLATPDLREVWEGVPTDWQGGNYPYEACNLVNHYWPPKDLRGVPGGEDLYVNWWKNYLREIYETCNENGEVRLRAIVGQLYPLYEAYGNDWLKGVIKELCEWEQSGPQDGVIAGWYLAEEPMGGGSHNYSLDVFDDMVAAIDEAESQGAYRKHDKYIDISLDGAHFSNHAAARFTRPADVVMISSSTYLWATSGVQPVYNVGWLYVHTTMHRLRGIVYDDRDRYGLPRPKIHLVLEAAYYAKGYGQPTNWEMRQQIREALTPDIKHRETTIEPADGIWFFWWPGMAHENEEKISDWIFGRRLAEAIETEVALVTGQGKEIRNPMQPTATRFAFPEKHPFNPNESAIPYELAHPGRVRIEVLDGNAAFLQAYEMGVQSAGRVHPFGGPRWTQSSANPDGQYIFKLYVDAILMDTAEVEVQSHPEVFSASHTPKLWSREKVIKITWRPPALPDGLAGYSYLWDTNSRSHPDRTTNLSASVNQLESEPLPDGKSHYFHLRCEDKTGDWSDPTHLGPFYLDASKPGKATDLDSSSHTVQNWTTDNTIDVSWASAEDATSGLKGYAIIWDELPGTLPPENMTVGHTATSVASEPLSDGRWYCHLRSVDVAGNWDGEAAHLGPFLIDTQPPQPPTKLVSVSPQTPGLSAKRIETNVWSNQNEVALSWPPANDATSGIAGYLTRWDTSPETLPATGDDSVALTEATEITLVLPDGQRHYFHLRSVDKSGQLSAETLHIGPFFIDTVPPDAVQELTLFGPDEKPHNPEDWLRDGHIRLEWQEAEDEMSGIADYLIKVNTHHSPFTTHHSPFTIELPDGELMLQILAVDNAGNVGEAASISVRVDSSVPAPKIFSSSHPHSEKWSADNSPIIEWATDEALSGIAGYSFAWDHAPSTTPDEEVDLTEEENWFRKEQVEDGVWYFHLRAKDKAGNVSEAAHYQIKIDAGIPAPPKITSPTHPPAAWTANSMVELNWQLPDSVSGIKDISFLFDQHPDTIPPDIVVTPASSSRNEQVGSLLSATSRAFPDDVWYFHLKAQNNAGLWSETAHYEIRIDTTVPPPAISSPSHPSSATWSTDNAPHFNWTIDRDLAGIDGYSLVWDNSTDTVPDETIDLPQDASAFTTGEVGDGIWYLHLRAIDAVGNASETADYQILVDSNAPAKAEIASLTHPPSTWVATSTLELNWPAFDSVSGISGISFSLDHNQGGEPDDQFEEVTTSYTSAELKDGVWYFHLKAQNGSELWSETAHYEAKIDTHIAKPLLSSPSHPENARWYPRNRPEITWTMPADTSGIAGYSFAWDKHPNTICDEDIDLAGNILSFTPPETADGVWYFHLRALDNAQNSSETEHLKIQIDSAKPPAPQILSPTHPTGKWTANRNVELIWQLPENASGIKNVSFLFDQNSTTIPPEIVAQASSSHNGQAAGLPYAVSRVLTDGRWYFHLKAQSGAGMWGETAHYEMLIDTYISKPSLSSLSHPESESWYTDNRPKITWTMPADTSGIAGYSFAWDKHPDTVCDENLDLAGNILTFTPPETANGVWYFHLRALDNAQNSSETEHLKIQIDSAKPPAPQIISPTHPTGKWTAHRKVELIWPAPDSVSGIKGFSFSLDQTPEAIPTDAVVGALSKLQTEIPQDGVWYFHLKAQNNGRVFSDTSHYQIWVDTTPPVIQIDYPQNNRWYPQTIKEYRGQALDETSGVDWERLEYRYNNLDWKRVKNRGVGNEWVADGIPETADTAGALVQARVRDKAGNIGISDAVIMRVDTAFPDAPITSQTHPDQKQWYSNHHPVFTWTLARNISGISGYSWRLDRNPHTTPPETIMLTGATRSFAPAANGFERLTDGTWYFHLRARNGAGYWGETEDYQVNIDTTPPRAWIQGEKAVDIVGTPVKSDGLNQQSRGEARFLCFAPNGTEVPAYFDTGRFYLKLTLSEVLPGGTPPKLYYQPNGKRQIALNLAGSALNWSSFIDVDMRLGDGPGEFLFEAVDRAGNIGVEIVEGKNFLVDTLLRKNGAETQYVLDVPAEAAIAIPPGALQQDIRLEISRFTTEANNRITYLLKAFDPNYRELPDISFLQPVEISLGYTRAVSAGATNGGTPTIFYLDGRQVHRVGGTVESSAKGKVIKVKVNHLGKFVMVISKPSTKLIAEGYAAPNPFAPSRSKTIFHVVPRDNNVQFTIKIFDLTGRLVKTLEDGNNVWDGKDEHGRTVEGGLYIYQIRADNEVISGTVVVVR